MLPHRAVVFWRTGSYSPPQNDGRVPILVCRRGGGCHTADVSHHPLGEDHGLAPTHTRVGSTVVAPFLPSALRRRDESRFPGVWQGLPPSRLQIPSGNMEVTASSPGSPEHDSAL